MARAASLAETKLRFPRSSATLHRVDNNGRNWTHCAMLSQWMRGASWRTRVNSEFLNAREAARYLGVSPTTLYKLINSGTLTTYRSEVNKRDRLMRRADLDRLKAPQPIGEKP